MKLNRKWVLVIALLLSVAVATAGTLAYLTDRDTVENTFTMGNVDIEVEEDYTPDSPLLPGVDVEKKAGVKNVHKTSDAWVWMTVSVPTDLVDYIELEWLNNAPVESETVTNVHEGYTSYVVKHPTTLGPGESTDKYLQGVKLSKLVDYQNGEYGYVENGVFNPLPGDLTAATVIVDGFAVQTEGFTTVAAAYDAYQGQWGEGNGSVEPPADAAIVTSATTYDDFAAIITAGKDIYVKESVTIANPESSRFTEFTLNDEIGLWMDEGVTLTFGETTTLEGSGKLTVYSGSIAEKQELCIAGDATIVFEGGEHSFNAFSASVNGKIVVNDGVLNCLGSYAGIMGITFGENGQLTVNDGKINLYQPINLNPDRCDAAYVEINGGTVELLNGIENLFVVRRVMDKDNTSGVLRGSSIRVNGGTFIAHYEVDSAGDATSFIRNGDSPADGNKVLVSNADKYDCVVTGGTFYGSWQRADNQRYTNGNGGYSDGQFVENSIAGFVADGYQITGDATNGYVVSAK